MTSSPTCPFLVVALFAIAQGCAAADGTSAPIAPDGCVADGSPVALVLDDLPVAEAQLIAQQTPIAAADGSVAIANIERGADPAQDLFGLRTVVRLARRDGAGCWRWSSQVIDTRTTDDPWHTPPAVGIDAEDRVHVAWNMHNYPWQYGYFADPGTLEDFRFRGEKVSSKALKRSVERNETSFPNAGDAAIPGTQITYPAFYPDRAGRLYVTYRFAAKPARRFAERTMSAGVAREEPGADEWEALGGAVSLAEGDVKGGGFFSRAAPPPIALAAETGWTLYHPRLGFGGGAMHVVLFWREGTAGSESSRACHLVTSDGETFSDTAGRAFSLPLRPGDCGNLDRPEGERYHTIGDLAVDSEGRAVVLLSPVEESRVLVSLPPPSDNASDGSDGPGTPVSEPSPWSATTIFFDADDALWAVASGPVLLARPRGATDWVKVYEGDEDACYPRVSVERSRRVAWLYTQGCEAKTVDVRRLDLAALLEPFDEFDAVVDTAAEAAAAATDGAGDATGTTADRDP